MLYFLLFMKPYPFLSYQLHSLSFPKYTNCFQSTDFFITVCSMLVTASFLYWILDWTSILNLTRTMIAHIKQIKAVSLFLETILYTYYHWRASWVYLLRKNGAGVKTWLLLNFAMLSSCSYEHALRLLLSV